MNRFRDRRQAGEMLAVELGRYAGERPLVLGLPRGGVPVAAEIAAALGAPLDVWVVRKVGVPWHRELGMGAISEGGYLHLSREVIDYAGVSDEELEAAIERERLEVEQRVVRFRGGHRRPELAGRTVILVDDGIATGGTVRAAILAIRAERPGKLVLAVPVVQPDTLERLAAEVDDAVALLMPSELYAIGLWYEDFEQVEDDEVVRLLERARAERPAAPEARV